MISVLYIIHNIETNILKLCDKYLSKNDNGSN